MSSKILCVCLWDHACQQRFAAQEDFKQTKEYESKPPLQIVGRRVVRCYIFGQKRLRC